LEVDEMPHKRVSPFVRTLSADILYPAATATASGRTMSLAQEEQLRRAGEDLKRTENTMMRPPIPSSSSSSSSSSLSQTNIFDSSQENRVSSLDERNAGVYEATSSVFPSSAQRDDNLDFNQLQREVEKLKFQSSNVLKSLD